MNREKILAQLRAEKRRLYLRKGIDIFIRVSILFTVPLMLLALFEMTAGVFTEKTAFFVCSIAAAAAVVYMIYRTVVSIKSIPGNRDIALSAEESNPQLMDPSEAPFIPDSSSSKRRKLRGTVTVT